MSGWIKLHRQIRSHWVFKNANYFKAWIVIISEVNHQSAKILIEGELIECKRGQSINSLATWVSILGDDWTIQKLRTFLKLLEKDEMINTEGLRKTTRLTVCNYDSYQSEQQANNKQTTSSQQGDNKEITTNKNVKNEKNMFIAPTHQEVVDYCSERNNNVDVNKFIDFYDSKGWMVGKNKMKDWKASIRTWEKSSTELPKQPLNIDPLVERAKKLQEQYGIK